MNCTCTDVIANSTAWGDDCAAVVGSLCDGNSFIPYYTFHYCTMASQGLEWLSVIILVRR